MVEVAQTLPSYRKVIGGNAPVIANRLAMEGAEILLASTGMIFDLISKDFF